MWFTWYKNGFVLQIRTNCLACRRMDLAIRFAHPNAILVSRKKMFGSGHEKLQKFSWQQRCGRQKWLTMDRAQFHVRNKKASFIHFVHCAIYTIPSNCQSVKWVHHNTKKHAESTHHSLRGSSSVDQKNTRITHFAFWRFRHFLCLLMRDSDNFLFFRAASGTVTTHTHTSLRGRASKCCMYHHYELVVLLCSAPLLCDSTARLTDWLMCAEPNKTQLC